MKKFTKKTKRGKTLATGTSPELEFDDLKFHFNLSDEHANGLRAIAKAIMSQTNSLAANIEDGKVLAAAFQDYSTTCNLYDVNYLGNCLKFVGEFQSSYEELKLKTATALVERLCTPAKNFADTELQEAKTSKEKFKELLGAVHSIDDIKSLEKDKRSKHEKKGKMSGVSREELEKRAEDLYDHFFLLNEKSCFYLLELLCSYLEEHFEFAQKCSQWFLEMKPEIEKIKLKSKEMKEEYLKKIEEREIEAKTPKPKMFGVELRKIVEREREKVPILVSEAIKALEPALDKEGLFRLSGNRSEMDAFMEALDRGQAVDFSQLADAHGVAGILKTFLRTLPDPVCPLNMFQDFVDVLQVEDISQRVEQLREVILRTPAENLCLLEYLMNFFERVCSHEDKNKMTHRNLAAVIAPTILYRDESEGGNLLEDVSLANGVIEFMISHYSELFKDIPRDDLVTWIQEAPSNHQEGTHLNHNQTPPYTLSHTNSDSHPNNTLATPTPTSSTSPNSTHFAAQPSSPLAGSGSANSHGGGHKKQNSLDSSIYFNDSYNITDPKAHSNNLHILSHPSSTSSPTPSPSSSSSSLSSSPPATTTAGGTTVVINPSVSPKPKPVKPERPPGLTLKMSSRIINSVHNPRDGMSRAFTVKPIRNIAASTPSEPNIASDRGPNDPNNGTPPSTKKTLRKDSRPQVFDLLGALNPSSSSMTPSTSLTSLSSTGNSSGSSSTSSDGGGKLSRTNSPTIIRRSRAEELVNLKLDQPGAFDLIVEEVFSPKSFSGWVLVGYCGDNILELQGHGDGSVDELIQFLDDTQVQYALIRIQLREKGTRDVFINWTGPAVSVIQKGRKKAYLGEVKDLLKPFHAELEALSRTNFTLDTVLDRSSPLSGSHVID